MNASKSKRFIAGDDPRIVRVFPHAHPPGADWRLVEIRDDVTPMKDRKDPNRKIGTAFRYIHESGEVNPYAEGGMKGVAMDPWGIVAEALRRGYDYGMRGEELTSFVNQAMKVAVDKMAAEGIR